MRRVILLVWSFTLACWEARNPIDALLVTEFNVRYSSDGAGDATVMELRTDSSGRRETPPEALRTLVGLRGDSLPLLIDHLTDRRPTKIEYEVRDSAGAAPLAFVALDILLDVAEGPIFVENCADDGMGACVLEPYYFLPNASQERMREVQENWRTLLKARKLHFKHPEGWSGVAPN